MKIDGIEPDYVETANDLVRKLSTIHLDHVYSPICRGQGAYEWKLEPGVLRKECKLRLQREGPLNNEVKLIIFELIVLGDFLAEADDIGLPIPSDSLKLRKDLKVFDLLIRRAASNLDEYVLDDLNKFPSWPWPDVLQIMALMQHSGLPTRLLDWTTKTLNAAYFAAKQTIENGLSGGYMAIYIINESNFSSWLVEGYQNEKLFLIKPITAGNINLINQKGCFTFHNYQVDEERFCSFHERHLSVDLVKHNVLGSAVYLLPQSEASELLLILDRIGINNSNLFPNWNGIANSLYERDKVRMINR